MSLLRFLPDRWKDRLRVRAGAATARARLNNLRNAGFHPRQIVDAGAFRGDWARLAHEIFPSAALLLIEPQPAQSAPLERLCSELQCARFRAALLGSREGRKKFLLWETNSQIVPDTYCEESNKQVVTLPVETLANVCESEGFGECDLLKLDLQGHEIEALEGAGELFGRIEAIVTEVSWLRIGEVPIMTDVLGAFAERGYRPYDVWGFNYRPRDRALWQTDILFVRADSPLLASRDWS